VLFSLEEASTYWSQALNWRTLVGSSIAAVLAKVVKARFTDLSSVGFIEFPDAYAGFEPWEICLFAVLGMVTGLFGGLFCVFAGWMARWRRHFFSMECPTTSSRRARVAEVLLLMLLTCSICFWIPLAFGCEPLDFSGSGSASDRRMAGSSDDEDLRVSEMGKVICTDGEYSDVFVLLMQPKEAVVKLLFSRDMGIDMQVSVRHLLACAVIVYLLTLGTFGSAVPCGLFIPHILCGAIIGRAFGEAGLQLGWDIHPGVYALMGSTGMLSGFSRMTISLAMIMLEITNSMRLLVPLIVTILTSKIVADRLSPSVNHVILSLNNRIHILEDELSEDRIMVLEHLAIHDACTNEVVVLHEREKTEHVVSLLMQSTFAGYPVVDSANRLLGLVRRSRLIHALSSKLEQLHGSKQCGQYINTLNLASTSPEVTYWNMSVAQSYRHFKAAGLQHLCVVNERNELLGVLTRTDFAQLCHPGRAGVEHIKMLMHRRDAAIAAGLVTRGSSSTCLVRNRSYSSSERPNIMGKEGDDPVSSNDVVCTPAAPTQEYAARPAKPPPPKRMWDFISQYILGSCLWIPSR